MTVIPRLAIFLALSGWVVLSAQEVRFIDLSNVQQRTELRMPSAGNGGGIGGVAIGDGAPDRRNPHALGVSLDRVDGTEITLDPFEADLRVINTGIAPIDIPVGLHLSDLQPVDESKPFTYLRLALVVDLDAGTQKQTPGMAYVELYGAEDHEGTVLTLQPGQWIRVKAKMQFKKWPSEDLDAKLQGAFWLCKVEYMPSEKGVFRNIMNLYPNPSVFPAVPVHFSPTRSGQQVR